MPYTYKNYIIYHVSACQRNFCVQSDKHAEAKWAIKVAPANDCYHAGSRRTCFWLHLELR